MVSVTGCHQCGPGSGPSTGKEFYSQIYHFQQRHLLLCKKREKIGIKRRF